MTMQGNLENDRTMLIPTSELLTTRECDQIIRSHECLIGYQWPPNERPSAIMVQHLKKFLTTLRFTANIYGQASDVQEYLCDGLLHVVKEIASEGYLTEYAVYTTEEQIQVCVIAFWPVQLPRDHTFRVPRRFEDLRK
jgi:hypothetical protein